MYNISAFLYDFTAAFDRPAEICDDIERRLAQRRLRPPGLLADLGAGTGLIGIPLADRGWNIYGIELSPAMVAVAAQKTARLPYEIQQRVTWTHGDISDFALPEGIRADAAICLCNTINHLLDWRAVEGFLSCTFNALRSGGVFVLDSDLRIIFDERCNYDPVVAWDDGSRRLSYSCRCDISVGRAYLHTTLVQYGGLSKESVSEETLELQYYPEDRLEIACVSAGFRVDSIERYTPSPYPKEKDAKLLWVLQKP